MSGPLSSNEIEDVVSSVRRLVSAEARPRTVSRDLGEDRLVLTPALRVVPEAASVSPLILTAPLTEDDSAPEPQASTLILGPSHEVGAAPAPLFEAEWEEEIWTEADPPLAELALGAEEAEVVTDAAPDVAPEAVEAASPSVEDAPWAEVGDAWLGEDAAPEAVAGAAEAPAQTESQPAPPADRPAAGPGVLELTAAHMLTDGEGNPLTVLDEEALQQIIRQLIREELKGVLGERITQSVRKLVRAEINRALAAHALD